METNLPNMAWLLNIQLPYALFRHGEKGTTIQAPLPLTRHYRVKQVASRIPSDI